MMKKHIGKADPADRFSCALCGGRQIVSGIIFKGRCICSECVKYLSAGSLSTDETTKAPVFFPDQFRVSRHLCKHAESYNAAAESKYRYGAETKPAETAKRQEKRKQEKGKKEEEKEQQTPKEEREKQSDEK